MSLGKKYINLIPIVRKVIKEMNEQDIGGQPRAKTTVVRFDTKTQSPFEVKFSERGFLIGGTRMSFELFDEALAKGINLTLENGSGMTLDAVKMQKVLKYRHLY